MTAIRDVRPTLLHVPVSHYSEKARWALDFKRIPHTRRWPLGGLHPLVSLIVTRGRHDTVPVLVLEGEAIGDSTRIIRRLEERYPEPPLYQKVKRSAGGRSSSKTSSTRNSGRTSAAGRTTT